MSYSSMRYDDFVIRFSPGPGGVYAVKAESPQGSGDGLFAIPESLRGPADHEGAPLGDGEPRDAVPRNRKADASERESGAELFQALFQGPVSKRFERSLGRLSGKDEGLRVLLEVDPQWPELAAIQDLPWECLYDPETGDFLALSRKTPVARSLRVPRERRLAISREKRLRILAISASPIGCPPLDLERERRNLERAWKGQIVPLQKTNREEIHRTFRDAPTHILHYMGHGSFDRATGEGTLLLEGKDGGVLPVSGRALAEELKSFPDLRLVVLNACHTGRSVGDAGPNPFAGIATAMVMGGVPAVVAMRQPISDAAAVAFSRALYERLAEGDLVEEAMADARLAIHRLDEKFGEWATPVLFLRDARKLLSPWLMRLLIAFLATTVILAILALYFGLDRERERRSSEALRHNNAGIALSKEGKEEEARKEFLAALKIDPNSAAAHSNLAVLLGDREEALEHALAAVEAEPYEAVYHYNLGTLWARRGSRDEARRSLEKALRLKPEYAAARNELGRLFLDLDRPAEARRELEAGLGVDPGLAPLHKNLARVDLAEGRIDAAIRGLETALGLYESGDRQGIAEALYWLAAAHARAGHREEACRRLEEVRHEAGTGHWVSEADRQAQQISCRRVS